jgi:hypothetical protein
MPWLLGVVIVAILSIGGFYLLSLRPVGGNLFSNEGFEQPAATFPTTVDRAVLSIGSGAIQDWQAEGTITWSRESITVNNNLTIKAKEGVRFVDLANRSATGPTGGVSQGLALEADRDYRVSVYVGTFPGAPPCTVRLRLEDTARITRRSRDCTSLSGNTLKWEKFTLPFDTRGWTVELNPDGSVSRSGAVYIEAPRDSVNRLNAGVEFIGVDDTSLFKMESTLGGLFR